MTEPVSDANLVMVAASTERLRAYVARLRLLDRGLTAPELRGLMVAQAELDRREQTEARP